MIVPTKITVNLSTQIDPVTKKPLAVVMVELANKSENGTYRGQGIKTLTIDSNRVYHLADPDTLERLPQTIKGKRILKALYGLFRETTEA